MKSGASPRSTPADFFSRYGKPEMEGVPKYVQLREALSTALRRGEWKAGDRLPTETELVELTALSLGTVQRALRDLVDDGLVVRNQGSGTFVAESRAPIDTPLMPGRRIRASTWGWKWYCSTMTSRSPFGRVRSTMVGNWSALGAASLGGVVLAGSAAPWAWSMGVPPRSDRAISENSRERIT